MSYATVEFADSYISTHYMSTDSNRARWEMLDEKDKAVLLNVAHDVIDSLPLTGRKTCMKQVDAFPRCPDEVVPTVVLNAECELALALSDEANNASLEEYRKMLEYGIQSYSIGNFSETLLTYNKSSLELQYGLNSAKAKRLLTPWLSGGYRIE